MPDVSCLFQAIAIFSDKVYISSHLSPEALLLTRSQRYEGWTGTSALMRSPYVLSSQDLYDTYVTCSEDQRHFSAQSTSTVPLSAERNCCRLESSKMAIQQQAYHHLLSLFSLNRAYVNHDWELLAQITISPRQETLAPKRLFAQIQYLNDQRNAKCLFYRVL